MPETTTSWRSSYTEAEQDEIDALIDGLPNQFFGSGDWEKDALRLAEIIRTARERTLNA